MKSTRILLLWNPALYIHLSLLYHSYIYHSPYLVTVSTYAKASCWSGCKWDDTLQSEESPRPDWSRGGSEHTFDCILFSQYNFFCWQETTLLFLIWQVGTWSLCTQGQCIRGYMWRLMGWYCWVQRESEDLHDCVLDQRIYWVEYACTLVYW